MNYRHAYHAGGVADVFKHTVLIALLERLKQKDAAFYVLDTHGGIGLYDLSGVEAAKTGEHLGGIQRLMKTLPPLPCCNPIYPSSGRPTRMGNCVFILVHRC